MGQSELKKSLGTRDKAEAKARVREVLDRCDALLASARAKALGQEAVLSLREITAAVGVAYRAEEARWADDPGPELHWDQQADYYGGFFEPDEEGSSFRTFTPDRDIMADAQRILEAQGIFGDRATIRTAAEVWARERHHLAVAMLKGVWQALFQALAAAGGPPAEVLQDSTHVKAHRCAAGGKGASAPRRSASAAADAPPRSTP